MDVLYVYCYKSVGSYKYKLSRTESLVFLYWGINCTIIPIYQIVIHVVKKSVDSGTSTAALRLNSSLNLLNLSGESCWIVGVA